MSRKGIDAPICQDSRSRSQVCSLARSVVCHHALKDLAGEKAFETADDLPFGPPFSGASFDVVEGWCGWLITNLSRNPLRNHVL